MTGYLPNSKAPSLNLSLVARRDLNVRPSPSQLQFSTSDVGTKESASNEDMKSDAASMPTPAGAVSGRLHSMVMLGGHTVTAKGKRKYYSMLMNW